MSQKARGFPPNSAASMSATVTFTSSNIRSYSPSARMKPTISAASAGVASRMVIM